MSAERVDSADFAFFNGVGSNCIGKAGDRIWETQELPDGRKVAQVLPNDRIVRSFEQRCAVSGCRSVGRVSCQGNVAQTFSGNGSCLEFQKQANQK